MKSVKEKYDAVLSVYKHVDNGKINDTKEEMRLELTKAFQDRMEIQTSGGSIFFTPKDEVELMQDVISSVQDLSEGSRVIREWAPQLPVELQLMVLEYSLVEPRDRKFKEKSTTLEGWNQKWDDTRRELMEAGAIENPEDLVTPPYAYGPTALFCVSEEMKGLAMYVFYGRNTFFFKSIDNMERYLSSITLEARLLIRHITLDFSGNVMRRKNGLQLLTTCTELHTLTLIISRDSTVGARRLNLFDVSLKSLRGISWILLIRGLRSLHVVFKEELREMPVMESEKKIFTEYLQKMLTRPKLVRKSKKKGATVNHF